MLNAVRTPLVLRDLAKHDRSLVEDLVNDAILRRVFQVLEGVLQARQWISFPSCMLHAFTDLNDEGACLVARQGSPFTLE